MSTTLWLVVVGSAIVTALIKGFGPVTIGGRELPAWSAGVIGLMAPALLAALVVVSALTDGKSIAVGPADRGRGRGGRGAVARRERAGDGGRGGCRDGGRARPGLTPCESELIPIFPAVPPRLGAPRAIASRGR